MIRTGCHSIDNMLVINSVLYPPYLRDENVFLDVSMSLPLLFEIQITLETNVLYFTYNFFRFISSRNGKYFGETIAVPALVNLSYS